MIYVICTKHAINIYIHLYICVSYTSRRNGTLLMSTIQNHCTDDEANSWRSKSAVHRKIQFCNMTSGGQTHTRSLHLLCGTRRILNAAALESTANGIDIARHCCSHSNCDIYCNSRRLHGQRALPTLQFWPHIIWWHLCGRLCNQSNVFFTLLVTNYN